jgi:uncharacterized protein involved in exopolysaccharide biosynthesis
MNAPATHRSQELSHKLYQRLLAAYPRSHRQEYGGAMAQLFRDQCRDAWAEGRGRGLVILWLRTLPDLVKTSFLERCASFNPGKFMTTKLNAFFPPGRTPFATFCAVFIMVFLLVFTTAAIITFILPESYASTAHIKIEGQMDYGFTTGAPADHIGVYDPFFVQTTFEIIQSQLVLSNVVSTLDLNAKWGKKYNGGEPLPTTETMEILKRRMVLQPVRNTKLISIIVYDEDRQEAADLANAVAKAYQDYRIYSRRELTRGGLTVLQHQLTETEAKIQAAQTNLDYLRTKFNLVDNDPSSINSKPSLSDQELQTYEQQLIEGQRAGKMLETQLAGLKELPGDKLRYALPTVTSDQSLTDLLGKLNAAEQSLSSLTNSLGPKHPKIIEVQAVINTLNSQIDQRVAGIMAALASEVKAKQAAVTALQAAIVQAKTGDEQEEVRTRPYWDAKRDFGNLLEFNKQLAAKIELTKIDLSIPADSLVQITDYAQPSAVPVKPNKPLNIALGAITGVLFGSVAGIIAATVAQRRLRRQPKLAVQS